MCVCKLGLHVSLVTLKNFNVCTVTMGVACPLPYIIMPLAQLIVVMYAPVNFTGRGWGFDQILSNSLLDPWVGHLLTLF